MKFCIVGTGRSGTTLLYRMMNTHPGIFVFNETHWLPVLHEYFGPCRTETALLLDVVARTRHVTGQPTTVFDAGAFRQHCALPDEMTVREFCDALGGYFAGLEGKPAWADKTPDYGFFTPVLQQYWPECRIIHLLRDGAAAARSMSRHIGYRALAGLKRQNWAHAALDFQCPADGFPDGALKSYVDLWYYRLLRTRVAAERLAPGSYMEVRFEDLVSDPAACLREIAGFAGLAPEAGWLEQAAGMVDRNRLANQPPPGDILARFAPRHLQLLDELGYPSVRPGAS